MNGNGQIIGRSAIPNSQDDGIHRGLVLQVHLIVLLHAVGPDTRRSLLNPKGSEPSRPIDMRANSNS